MNKDRPTAYGGYNPFDQGNQGQRPVEVHGQIYKPPINDMNMQFAKQTATSTNTDYNDLFKAEMPKNQPAPFGGPKPYEAPPINTGNAQTDDFLAQLENLKKL